LLERAVAEGFMDAKHRSMWSAVSKPEQVAGALRAAAPWTAEARAFAVVR
jgi:hypothetical protein